MLNGEGEEEDGDCIRYQPAFGLIREDSYEVHRVLEVLVHDKPDLATLGTVVKGVEAVAEAGMGIQYFYSADAVRKMADAYQRVSQQELLTAIESVRPEFNSFTFETIPAIIAERFPTIQEELSLVAKNGWAMVAGMF